MNWMIAKVWSEWTDEKDYETVWIHDLNPMVRVINMENINSIIPRANGFSTIKTITPARKLNADIIALCGDFAEAMNLAISEREKIEGDDDE